MSRRPADALRDLVLRPHCMIHPEGAVLIACGATQVLCTASVEERVPPWLNGKGRGWVTAEYDMLPRATNTRNGRDSHRGKVKGRTQEIGRLIGRALRAVVDTQLLGERTITVDCDVLQADGGTRTAAITGGCVALALAIAELSKRRGVHPGALKQQVAAISVGMVDGSPHLDLDYALDVRADVDMNVVMTADGNLVEVQGTAEGAPFSRSQLDAMLDLAFSALPTLVAAQQVAVATPYQDPRPGSLLGDHAPTA